MDIRKLRLISFDMDGTVLADRSEITSRLARALSDAAKRRILVVPCTGRGRSQVPKTVEELRPPFTITSNGARIRDEKTGDTICRKLLDWQIAAEVLGALKSWDVFVCVHMDETVWHQWGDEEYIRRRYRVPSYAQVLLTDDARALVRGKRHGVEKIFVRAGEAGEREEIRGSILARFPVSCSSSSAYNLEFSAPDCSKGAALRWLCGRLGIEGSEVMAFGDGENDREMLQFAGRGIAVGNALPVCREAADEIIGDCASDGVAEYLEKIFTNL
ncbi:MAG: HAD family phosphatase [Lachnospiraceae bacterium]|nr:HAD family phosphatase [Lachnospiraceae bacterium]